MVSQVKEMKNKGHSLGERMKGDVLVLRSLQYRI